MASITSFLQRYPVATFCTLTILLTFATYLLPLPREALPFVMVLIPAIIAILLVAITEGIPGVRSLLRFTRAAEPERWAHRATS